MENKKTIEALIEKYGLKDPRNGKIMITKNQKEAAVVIPPIKADILAYWEEERETKKAEAERRQNAFNAIPGVRAIRDARAEWSKYKSEFDRVMHTGGSVFPPLPAVDLDTLEEANPLAVWALAVEHQARYGANVELTEIAKKAYTALTDGEGPEAVRASYDQAKSKFAQKHLWD